MTRDPKNKALRLADVIAASFTVLVITIIFLMIAKVITFEMAMLMLVALLGMYIGFGILIAVYRFVAKLD
jgi:hypothetical protein